MRSCPKCHDNSMNSIASKRLNSNTIGFVVTCSNGHKYGWTEEITEDTLEKRETYDSNNN